MHLFVGTQPYHLVCGMFLGFVAQQQLSHFQRICLCSQVKRGDVLHFTSKHLQVTASSFSLAHLAQVKMKDGMLQVQYKFRISAFHSMH